MRIERHPKLNVLVREDGCVYLPQSGVHPAHWTYGCDNGHGYLRVRVAGKRYFVHRLILETFVGPAPKDKPEADHIDRDTHHNSVSNLRWTDRTGNNRNTLKQDRVEARGLPHRYEDADTYNHGSCKAYYRGHRETILKQKRQYRKAMKLVLFADGKPHWVSRPCANELLKIPRSFRIYK